MSAKAMQHHLQADLVHLLCEQASKFLDSAMAEETELGEDLITTSEVDKVEEIIVEIVELLLIPLVQSGTGLGVKEMKDIHRIPNAKAIKSKSNARL